MAAVPRLGGTVASPAEPAEFEFPVGGVTCAAPGARVAAFPPPPARRPVVAREARLAAFVLLLAAIFVAARAAGATLGPLTTSHSHISYTGTAGTGGGMKMGSPGPPATPPPGGGR